MSNLRLYKKFYVVTNDQSLGTQSYALSTPFFLSANTYTAGTGATESSSLVEANILTTEESTGVYFATLDPDLYLYDTIFDLVWFVQYTSASPIKKISTRFKVNISSTRYVHQLEAELVSQVIEIEILNQTMGFEIN